MTEPDDVRLPRWGRIAILVAAILLIIVVATSVDFSGDDEPDRPNLIGFESTTVTR
ncbi:MAG: hypothetical protein ABIQ73_16185 [Acidimicrobiales bacterium]